MKWRMNMMMESDWQKKNGIDIMTEKDAKPEITTSVQYLFCKE